MSEEVKNKSEYLVEVRDLKQYFPDQNRIYENHTLKSGGRRILFHQAGRNPRTGRRIRLR